MTNHSGKTLPVRLSGTVVHGKGIGRTAGMPTANICVTGGQLPELGVYATRATIGGKRYNSVTNIGTRPSVDEGCEITVETHIMDFQNDIYGEQIELEVLKFLRPIQKFESLEAVSEQVKKDVKQAKKCLTLTD